MEVRRLPSLVFKNLDKKYSQGCEHIYNVGCLASQIHQFDIGEESKGLKKQAPLLPTDASRDRAADVEPKNHRIRILHRNVRGRENENATRIFYREITTMGFLAWRAPISRLLLAPLQEQI